MSPRGAGGEFRCTTFVLGLSTDAPLEGGLKVQVQTVEGCGTARDLPKDLEGPQERLAGGATGIGRVIMLRKLRMRVFKPLLTRSAEGISDCTHLGRLRPGSPSEHSSF